MPILLCIISYAHKLFENKIILQIILNLIKDNLNTKFLLNQLINQYNYNAIDNQLWAAFLPIIELMNRLLDQLFENIIK